MLSKVQGPREAIVPLAGKERSGELIDLTGGMGVDCYYLSEGFEEVHYVERDEELCRLAEHNFALTHRDIAVHHMTAEEWLNELKIKNEELRIGERVIFVDPARRDAHGGKVFRLEDCEPNVVELLNILRACARRILLKLSPMLDITAAVRSLGGAAEVHVVAVKNEVKEVLVLLEDGRDSMDPEIHCVNLETDEEEFAFRRSEEERAITEGLSPSEGKRWNYSLEPSLCSPPRPTKVGGTVPKNNTSAIASPLAIEGLLGGRELVLIEPNAAILKAGAFRVFGEKYGLQKLGPNTQLYAVPGTDKSCMQEGSKAVAKIYGDFCENEEFLKHVPGRVFVVHPASKEELKEVKKANIICRNYPLSPDALKKKLKVRDGGEKYIIATQIGSKPTIFLGIRQFFHI